MEKFTAVMGEKISEEPLEAMLHQGERELFPKLRKYLAKFIDVFNHDSIQQKIQNGIEEINRKVADIEIACSSGDVFQMLQCLREYLSLFKYRICPVKFFDKIQQTGYFTLINDDKFMFLEDEIELDKSAEKLLALIDEFTKAESTECVNRRFEEYLAVWTANQRRLQYDEMYIIDTIASFMEDKRRADQVNDNEAQNIIDDLLRYFEPLREKLMKWYVRPTGILAQGMQVISDTAETAATVLGENIVTSTGTPISIVLGYASPINIVTPALGYASQSHIAENETNTAPNDNSLHLDSAATTRTIRERKETSRFASRNSEWFDKTRERIINYLMQTNSEAHDNEFMEFLSKERLQQDNEHFSVCIREWLDKTGLVKMLKSRSKSFVISKSTALAEIERVSKFMYAVILNKPERVKEYEISVENLLHQAANVREDGFVSYIPLFAFDQLPLPDKNQKRTIRLVFVVPFDTSDKVLQVIIKEIKEIFANSKNQEFKTVAGIQLFQFDLDIDENFTILIAKNIRRLSDLSIRAVLVGSFGLGGFRHAMNPTYNRIYSENAKDKAEGFIETCFHPLLRGQEPYYCPNGWRRYSIDVGKTEHDFEIAYGHWPVAYHGTYGHNAMPILLNGLKATGQGCYINEGGDKSEGAIYLSPSIEYCGHPRYARVWKVENKYMQLVLQCRINPKFLFDKRPSKFRREAGTLEGAEQDEKPIDPNFTNDRLEWVIKMLPKTRVGALGGILVYGLMMRITDIHPGHLPQNKWWEETRKVYHDWDYF